MNKSIEGPGIFQDRKCEDQEGVSYRLRQRAMDEGGGILEEIEDPKWWLGKGGVHDWRNHVPGFLQEMWSQLQPETRLAIALVANEAANNEEWD